MDIGPDEAQGVECPQIAPDSDNEDGIQPAVLPNLDFEHLSKQTAKSGWSNLNYDPLPLQQAHHVPRPPADTTLAQGAYLRVVLAEGLHTKYTLFVVVTQGHSDILECCP